MLGPLYASLMVPARREYSYAGMKTWDTQATGIHGVRSPYSKAVAAFHIRETEQASGFFSQDILEHLLIQAEVSYQLF